MSFHPGQSFTFGEVPSTTKWNYLWENDYALADGSGIDAGAILNSHLAAEAVDSTKIDWNASTGKIWWEELGRTTLSADSDTISIGSFAAKTYLMFIWSIVPNGIVDVALSFNLDTGNNYHRRFSTNGGADSTGQTTAISVNPDTAATTKSGIVTVLNVAGQEKIVNLYSVTNGAAGAANAPARREGICKWANTVDQITSARLSNSGAGNCAAGSELIVLGHN